MNNCIKRFGQVSLITLFVLLPTSVLAEHPLTFLTGHWSGSGSTSGMQSSLEFDWQPALNGHYYSLQINNQMTTKEGQLFFFAGIAYYKPDEGETLTGVWVDSQGDILPIKAYLEGQTLIANWGEAGSKYGRSTYHLTLDGSLEVVDEVGTETGEYQEFGRSKLTRDSAP